MPSLLSTLSSPLLLLLSLPLALFALLTTTLALTILTLRVSILYAELLAALLQTSLLPSHLTRKNPALPSEPIATRPASRRSSSRSSSISSGFLPPQQQRGMMDKKSRSSVTLTNGGVRDYEGVGGWRVQGEDEEEALWMGMNSRLRLPARSLNHSHRGSFVLGSGQVSPELVRTPRVTRGSRDGTASPESYFAGVGLGLGFGFGGLTPMERVGEGGGSRSWAGSCVSLGGGGGVLKGGRGEGW
ncbi:hypothetical protein Tdes44962_MAKER04282 [Teratosphaeria destructans]|uniref:Uncharacterized protein n=1 Tax=Teratosphaeria destructans TaxID=418781 RepID=A0A9W7SNA3_9PEZI|nr:hypothetical protein Tdes44962_MAKER04282 [Teratosphaeria destructans]